MKKLIVFLACFVFLSSIISIVSAQANRIEISTSKPIFNPGENITLMVSLRDSQNNQINDQVSIIIEDAAKLRGTGEILISSNEFVDVNIGENPIQGYWTITAKYESLETKEIFTIEGEEIAEFTLEENVLTIKNVGNTKYSKTVQIVIGESVGVKQPNLNIGEKISYRLIAPEGSYNIKVTDGETTLTKGDVILTGNVIGILDERISKKAPLTGTLGPDEEENPYDSLKQNRFFYIIVSVIVGGAALLIAERAVSRKTEKKSKSKEK